MKKILTYIFLVVLIQSCKSIQSLDNCECSERLTPNDLESNFLLVYLMSKNEYEEMYKEANLSIGDTNTYFFNYDKLVKSTNYLLWKKAEKYYDYNYVIVDSSNIGIYVDSDKYQYILKHVLLSNPKIPEQITYYPVIYDRINSKCYDYIGLGDDYDEECWKELFRMFNVCGRNRN